MRRYACVYSCIGMLALGLFPGDGQAQQRTTSSVGQTGPVEVFGQASEGLKPSIFARKQGLEWSFDLEFFAQSNFSRFAWLRITNHAGSTLQLSESDGTQLHSTNADILAAMQLPADTSVSNILNGVPWRARGGQWMRTRLAGSRVGESGRGAHFSLLSAFGIPATNDFVISISPLLYRVGTNGATATLVQFEAITLKLLTNGNVEALNKPNSPASP
jgi:hypothetical protein